MRDTMIQYQNVYDAFMRCDTDKLAEEFAALYDESKKDAEKRLEAAQKVIHASYERMKNTTLASNEDESMVVVCKCHPGILAFGSVHKERAEDATRKSSDTGCSVRVERLFGI